MVSRETSGPPEPESARGVFADRLEIARRYAAWLADDGVVRGLIGPREVPRLWGRHLMNSTVLTPWLPQGSSVADLGSGAGLPGIPLAIVRPDLTITLVEPLLRRTTFLEEVVADLELTNVSVVRARAEELHGRDRFDVVTSRAVAPLPKLLNVSMPLVAAHGAMVVLKGSRVAAEIEEAGPVLKAMGCAQPESFPVEDDTGESTTTVLRVAWADPESVSWPLRPPAVAGAKRAGRRSTNRKQRK